MALMKSHCEPSDSTGPTYTSRLTIRMPTSTHDIFTELVAQEIRSQIESVARGDTDIAAVLDLVKSESAKVIDIWVNCPSVEICPR